MNKIVKRSLLAMSVAAGIGAMTNAYATNGYELIGIGGYQMGMAGAVVAAPGSAMTAVTNPAGLAAVTPAADFSIEAFMPDRHVNFNATGGGNEDSDTKLYGVPALGWSAQTSPGSNLYFGGGMYGTSGMGVDYPQTSFMPTQSMSFKGYSNISLWQMAPALAWKVNRHLMLGAALDIGYMSASFQQQFVYGAGPTSAGTVMNGVNMARSASAFAVGATLGMLYKINPMITVGASYTTQQKYNLKYNLGYGDIVTNNGADQYPAGRYTMTMKTPQMAAIGAAITPMKPLLISAEVKWIDWSQAMNNISVTGPQDYNGFTPKWKDQTVYALAVNYMINPKLAIRGGINYAKSPIRDNTVMYNLVLPAVVQTHYTLGVSYQMNRHWGIGAAYMYAPKKTYTQSNTSAAQASGMTGTKIDLSEQAFSFNLKYVF